VEVRREGCQMRKGPLIAISQSVALVLLVAAVVELLVYPSY